MADIKRASAMSITRVTSTGADPGDTFAEEGRIHGKANNIVLPNIVIPHLDYFGPIGTERAWNGTAELGDFSFDLLDASEAPEGLGPADLYFDVTTRLSTGILKKYRIGGKFQTQGQGSYDRGAEFPRPMTVFPFLFIVGGGPGLGVNQTDIDEPSEGDNTGPFAFVHLRAGKFLTREVGASTILWLPQALTA